MTVGTGDGLTVTVAGEEFAEEQLPAVTTALYAVVTSRFVAVKVARVLGMSVDVTQLSFEYCHFVMLPV